MRGRLPGLTVGVLGGGGVPLVGLLAGLVQVVAQLVALHVQLLLAARRVRVLLLQRRQALLVRLDLPVARDIPPISTRRRAVLR